MSSVETLNVPFLELSDPTFSIRSQEVRAARERSWYARTPHGIAGSATCARARTSKT